MLVLCPEHVEAPLPILVGDAILDLWSNHHLDTVHEVIHHIVETWLQCLQVDDVKVNFLFCGNLDTNISLDVEQEASDW